KDRLGALRRRETQAESELREVADQAQALAIERETVGADVAILEEGESGVRVAVAQEETRLAELAASSEQAEREVVGFRQAMSQAQRAIASSEAKLEGFVRRKDEMRARSEKLTGEQEQREGTVLELRARSEQLALAIEDLRTGKVTSAEEKAL